MKAADSPSIEGVQHLPAVVADVGALDLDDVGAHVGQHQAAHRPGHHVATGRGRACRPAGPDAEVLSWPCAREPHSMSTASRVLGLQPQLPSAGSGAKIASHQLGVTASRCGGDHLGLAVLVDEQRAHALGKLAVLEQPHGEAVLDVERLLQRGETARARMAASVSFRALGDFCASAAAVLAAHSPGMRRECREDVLDADRRRRP